MIRTNITGIGDPFILPDGGKYYMYATSAKNGFRYFVSEDLYVWEDGGLCYSDSGWGEGDFWAPEVFLRDGKYYMIYTARWKKNHSLRIGLAVSGSPCGPFKDVNNGPMFDFGYAAIDATLFTDTDGRNYLYFVRDCSENIIAGVHTSVIYCCEVSNGLQQFLSEPVKISEPDVLRETYLHSGWRWNEGPALYKRNGKYYLNYSVNRYDDRNYNVSLSMADNPFGPFVKYPGNPIIWCDDGDFSGPGHNSFFTGYDGKLYTAFHIHTDPVRPSGDRRACIAEVDFDENGIMKVIL